MNKNFCKFIIGKKNCRSYGDFGKKLLNYYVALYVVGQISSAQAFSESRGATADSTVYQFLGLVILDDE